MTRKLKYLIQTYGDHRDKKSLTKDLVDLKQNLNETIFLFYENCLYEYILSTVIMSNFMIPPKKSKSMKELSSQIKNAKRC